MGVQSGQLQIKKEAIIIENVQRRATRLIKEIQHLSYGNRLKHLGLPRGGSRISS